VNGLKRGGRRGRGGLTIGTVLHGGHGTSFLLRSIVLFYDGDECGAAAFLTFSFCYL